MILISLFKTEFLVKLATPLFIISFYFTTFSPNYRSRSKGAKRWVDLYFFRLQPIEILKPFFVLMTVKILTFQKFHNPQIKYILSFISFKLSYSFIN